MRDIIINVLAELTGVDKNNLTDGVEICNLDGFDSLQFVMMISELQENYNIEIPLEEALEVKTIGELIASARTLS